MVDQIIQEIERCGYSITPALIQPDQLKIINQYYADQRLNFKPAKIAGGEHALREDTIRGDYSLWINPLEPEPAFTPVINFLEELRQSFNSHFYLGLKEFECHIAYYPVGTFYKKHSDTPAKASTRVVSFIFYLNEEWNENDGGELVIYDKKGNILESVLPKPGTFVCFLSGEFPHEVKSANKERRSFTGWMHTKIIY